MPMHKSGPGSTQSGTEVGKIWEVTLFIEQQCNAAWGQRSSQLFTSITPQD